MKERPILFSAPMVRAVLEGRKTQTRRIVKHKWKPEPENGPDAIGSGWATIWPGKHVHTWDMNGVGGANWNVENYPDEPNDLESLKGRALDAALRQGFVASPYGQAGDRLWVRETFSPCECIDGLAVHYKADDKIFLLECDEDDDGNARPLGPSDHESDDFGESPWKPSIHMPRWASRILLEVTGVRVERLQEISEEDAKAEGCLGPKGDGYMHDISSSRIGASACMNFQRLWFDLNGIDSWAANPWCWVIEFKRLKP